MRKKLLFKMRKNFLEEGNGLLIIFKVKYFGLNLSVSFTIIIIIIFMMMSCIKNEH